MGKGAELTIRNFCRSPVSVTYSNQVCMYEGGASGSDFAPITGDIAPGDKLPAGPSQYLEAKASGSCVLKKSTFTMEIKAEPSACALDFTEHNGEYSAVLSRVIGGRLVADVDVREAGDRYSIDVAVWQDFWSTASWMGDLADKLGGVALRDLVIPGTHDSATSDIGLASAIGPEQDIPSGLNLTPLANWLGPMGDAAGVAVQGIIAGWSRAQGLDVGRQLADGIRYLDLRIAKRGDEFWTLHSKYSTRFTDVVAQVALFLNAHPGEVVILDLNHLYAFESPADHIALVDLLKQHLGDRMVGNALNPSATLAEFQESDKRAVVVYADSDTVKRFPNVLWDSGRVWSWWYEDTNNVGEVMSHLEKELRDRPDQLFVLQGIISPNFEVVKAGLVPGHPGGIRAMAEEVTPPVVRWVQDQAGRPVNILIVDRYDVSPAYSDRLIAMNLWHTT